MKNILLTTIFLLASGCGTIRYQLISEKEHKGKAQLQWDVVEVKFNDFWKEIIPVFGFN